MNEESAEERANGRAAAAIREAAVRVCGISLEELWLDYFALGGDATPSQVREFLAGSAPLEQADHDRLVVVLNERLAASGQGRPLAFWVGSR